MASARVGLDQLFELAQHHRRLRVVALEQLHERAEHLGLGEADEHRVSIPLTQLLGQKTEISWITDGNW